MNIETVPVDSISEDPANARSHPDKNLEAIKDSLKRFGQQKPIVVDMDNVIVAGNGLYRAAKTLGWTEIAVVHTRLSGIERKAYAVADNRLSELSEWDYEELSRCIEDLKAEDLLIGWEDVDIEPLLRGDLDPTPPPAPPLSSPSPPQPGSKMKIPKLFVSMADDHAATALEAIELLRRRQARNIDESEALSTICSEWLAKT